MSSTCYNIHLRPAVILKNLLPLDLIFGVTGVFTDKKLKAGESIQMPTAEPGDTDIALRVSISSNHTLTNQLTPRSLVLVKLPVTQLLKTFPTF
jgi:hypothetical protein